MNKYAPILIILALNLACFELFPKIYDFDHEEFRAMDTSEEDEYLYEQEKSQAPELQYDYEDDNQYAHYTSDLDG